MRKLILVLVIIALLSLVGGCQSKSKIDDCRLEFLDDTKTFIELIERDLENAEIDAKWLNRGREGGMYISKYLNEQLSDQEAKIFNDLLQSFKFITFDETKETNLKKFSNEIEKIKKIISY